MKWSKDQSLIPLLVIQKGDVLSDAQITSALRVGEQTMWWRALTQLIIQYRSEYAGAAPQNAAQNNSLGMARDVGAHEALSGLLIDLEERRSSSGD